METLSPSESRVTACPGVDRGGDAEGVFDFEAGDEAGAELAADGGVLGEFAEGAIVGECDKGGTKNGHQLTLPEEAPGTEPFVRQNSFAQSNGLGSRSLLAQQYQGSTDSARCAGIHVASSPSKAIARTTPPSTSGSRGVA